MHKLGAHEAVKPVKTPQHTEGKGAPALFQTRGKDFLAQHALHDEIFGPASLLVACADLAEMRLIAENLEGQLTATLQMDDDDTDAVRAAAGIGAQGGPHSGQRHADRRRGIDRDGARRPVPGHVRRA
ncbi:hypothetical protein LP419_30225 [Massilia sp. H-1]|nr:hypothetical protein LP419_30225 [Massilia sp. H-1]